MYCEFFCQSLFLFLSKNKISNSSFRFFPARAVQVIQTFSCRVACMRIFLRLSFSSTLFCFFSSARYPKKRLHERLDWNRGRSIHVRWQIAVCVGSIGTNRRHRWGRRLIRLSHMYAVPSSYANKLGRNSVYTYFALDNVDNGSNPIIGMIVVSIRERLHKYDRFVEWESWFYHSEDQLLIEWRKCISWYKKCFNFLLIIYSKNDLLNYF